MHISKKILIEISISLIVVSFVTVLLIKRYVYFKPGNTVLNEPFSELQIEVNPFDLSHVWLANNKTKKPLVIFCQDRFGNMGDNQIKIKSMFEAGFSIIMFNYPGYGNRKGVPTQDEFFMCTRKLLSDFEKVGYNLSKDIIMWGDGIGTSVAIDSAIRYQIPIVIISNYVSSIKTQLPSILSPLKFCFGEFNCEKLLEYYNGTIIVRDGSIVPAKHVVITDPTEIFNYIVK